MNKKFVMIFSASLGLLLLSACRDEAPADEVAIVADPSAQEAPVEPQQRPSSSEAVMPTTVSADAVAVGKAVGANGAVSGTSAVFSASDTVHASIPAAGRAAGSEVQVYWTFEDGSSHKEERKRIAAGAEFVTFAFSHADGMKAGRYSIQVDVDGTPVGIVDITVQ